MLSYLFAQSILLGEGLSIDGDFENAIPKTSFDGFNINVKGTDLNLPINSEIKPFIPC